MTLTTAGVGVMYQAAVSWVVGLSCCNEWAASAAQKNLPIRMGVVRTMGWSDYGAGFTRPGERALAGRRPPIASAAQGLGVEFTFSKIELPAPFTGCSTALRRERVW
jgi:hypothetical protein